MRMAIATLMIAVLAATAARAGLTEYLDTVGAPTDSGAGPALWYKTARSPNDGSGGGSYTLTSGGPMTDQEVDFWDNTNSAYGLIPSATVGAAVAGSTGLFASGTNGTVSFLFKTPEALSGFTSLFNQGSYADASPFELGINVNVLRLTTMNGVSKVNTNIGTLSPDTWYYFCMRWDTSLPSDDLIWYYGTAGSSLNSGTVTITAIGDPGKPIYVGGRAIGNVFAGGFFQSIAIYERMLSDSAVRAQFNETVSGSIPPAAAYANAVETPSDGGAGPELWYKTAEQISGTHMLNSGTAGTSYTAYRLGEVTHADYFGNTNMAFGISGANYSASVAGSTGLFMTSPTGTVSVLFKTPTSLVNASLFRQGANFELFLLGAGNARLTVNGSYLTLPSIAADTWYYLALRWDAAAGTDNLAWYMGEAGGTLSSGTATITGTGASGAIEIAGRVSSSKFLGAMQHFAFYERTLSDAAMRDQFNALLLPWRGSYFTFTEHYGIDGEPDSAPEEDYDGDGQRNVYEYGLGGDPTDPLDVGTEPVFSCGASNEVSFKNVVLTNPDADITYTVEQTEDLVSGPWSDSGWSLVSTNTTADSEYDEVEHRIDGRGKDKLFIRLRITQP